MFGEKGTVAWIAGGSIWMVVLLLGASRYFFEWPGVSKNSSERKSRRSDRPSHRSDRTEPLLQPSRSGRDADRWNEEVAPSRSEGRSSSRSSKSQKALSLGAQYSMYGQVGDVPEDVRRNYQKAKTVAKTYADRYVPEVFRRA